MVSKLQKNNKGFTIIEVLIVLAIAGLIMLIVFLAVPALQRNQRNNARTTEAARISTLVTECMANRNGVPASCQTQAAIGWVNTDFQQITAVAYTAGLPPVNNHTLVRWNFSQVCNVDGSDVVSSTNTKLFAVTYRLEKNIPRCIDSE